MAGKDAKSASRQNEDCLTCRIVGGAGLIGASWYVFTGIRHQHPGARPLVFLFGAGLGYVGVARLAQWPPFDPTSTAVKRDSSVH